MRHKKSKAPWAAHGWVAQSQVYFCLCGKTSLCANYKYENICHLYCHLHENQVIFMWNVLHKHLFCKWQVRRWKSSLHNVPSSPSGQHSFQFLYSRKWLGVFLLPHPPGWDASPLQDYPQTLILPVPIYTPKGILRDCESKVFRPRTQYNVPSQGLNPDYLK